MLSEGLTCSGHTATPAVTTASPVNAPHPLPPEYTGVSCSSELSLPLFTVKYSSYSDTISGVQQALSSSIFHSTTPQRYFCGLASESKHVSKRECVYDSQQLICPQINSRAVFLSSTLHTLAFTK